jgi:hypothetical protein
VNGTEIGILPRFVARIEVAIGNVNKGLGNLSRPVTVTFARARGAKYVVQGRLVSQGGRRIGGIVSRVVCPGSLVRLLVVLLVVPLLKPWGVCRATSGSLIKEVWSLCCTSIGGEPLVPEDLVDDLA